VLISVLQRLRELMVWTYLEHPNIVPLLGVVFELSPYASMVSPWYTKGSVRRYLEQVGDTISTAERLRLVSSPRRHIHSYFAPDMPIQLSDVAAGLSYRKLFR
jgi:hypothetical protein